MQARQAAQILAAVVAAATAVMVLETAAAALSLCNTTLVSAWPSGLG
jgi:hypothetical protein